MSAYELLIGPWNISSHSLAAWLALQAAGMEFVTQRLDTGDPDVARQIEELSPGGRLPVLRRDGVPVAWELWGIFEFAAERAPELWPAGPEDRARARSITAEVLGFSAFQTFLPMDFTGRFDPPAALLRPVEREAARLRALWAECRERAGDTGLFLFGDFGLVDAAMVPFAARFRTHGLPLGPVEQTYVETLLALDAVLFWEEQARAERAEPAAARPKAAAPRLAAGPALASGGSPTRPGSGVAPPPGVSQPAPAPAAPSARGTAAAGPGTSAERPATVPPVAAPPVDAVPPSQPPGNGDPSSRQPAAASEADAEAASPPRRPLFGKGGLFRRRTAPQTIGGFGPLPLGPTALPDAPLPETLRRIAPEPPAASGEEPQTGSPRPVERTPPVKPIGIAARRRR